MDGNRNMDGNRGAASLNPLTGQPIPTANPPPGAPNYDLFRQWEQSVASLATNQPRVSFADQRASNVLPATISKYPDSTKTAPTTGAGASNQPGNNASSSGFALYNARSTAAGADYALGRVSSTAAGADYNPYDYDDEQYDPNEVPPLPCSLGKPQTLFWPWSRLYQVTDPAFWAQLLIACYDTHTCVVPEITDLEAMRLSVYQYLRTRATVQMDDETLFGPQTDNIEIKVLRIPTLRYGRLDHQDMVEKPLVVRYLHPETRVVVDTSCIRPFPPVAADSPQSSDAEAEGGDQNLITLNEGPRTGHGLSSPVSRSRHHPTKPPRRPTSAVRTAARLKCRNPATDVQQYLADLRAVPPPRREDQEYTRRLREQQDQVPHIVRQVEERMQQMAQQQQQQLAQQQRMEALVQQLSGRLAATQQPEPFRPQVALPIVPPRAAPRDDQSDVASVQGGVDRWATTRIGDSDAGPPRLQHAKSLADLGSVANLHPGEVKQPKLTLDPFSGSQTDTMVDEWLQMYQCQMAALGHVADADLIRFLIMSLKGPAAKWYRTYLKAHPDLFALSWDRVVTDLCQRYLTDSNSLYSAFQSLKPSLGEPLLTYAHRLEAAFQRALPEATARDRNRELANVFIRNVSVPLRKALKMQFVLLGTGPPDFQQIRAFAAKWETNDMDRDHSVAVAENSEALLRAAAAVFQPRPLVNIQPPAAQPQGQYPAPGAFSTFSHPGMAPLSFPPPKPYGQYQPQYQSGDQRSQQQPRGQWQQAQWQQWVPDPVTNFVYDVPQPPRERPEHASLTCTQCNQVGHFWRLCPTLEACNIPSCRRRHGHYGRRCPALRDADYAQVQGTYPAQSNSQSSFQQQQGTGTPVHQYTQYPPPQPSAGPSLNSDAVPTGGAAPYQRVNINRLLVHSPTNGGPIPAFGDKVISTAKGLGLLIPPTRGPSPAVPFRMHLDQTQSAAPRIDWNSMDNKTKQRIQADVPTTVNRLNGAQPVLPRQPLHNAESPEIIIGVDGQQIQAVIDPGAQVTTMSSYLYAQIHPEWDGRCLQESTVSLYGFLAAQPAGTLGSQPVKLTFGNVTVEHQVSIANDPRGTFTILIGQDINRIYAHTLCEYKKTVRYNRGALKDVELPLIAPEELQLRQPPPKKVHFQAAVQIFGSEPFEDSFTDPTVPLMPDPCQGLRTSQIYRTPDLSPVMTESLPKRGILKHSPCTPSSSLTPTYSYPDLGTDASFDQTPTPSHFSSEVVLDPQEALQVQRCRSQGATKVSVPITFPHEGPDSDVSAALPAMSAEQQSEESDTGMITPQEVDQVANQKTSSTIPPEGPSDIPVASKAPFPARASRPVQKTRTKRDWWAQLIRKLPPLAEPELKGGKIVWTVWAGKLGPARIATKEEAATMQLPETKRKGKVPIVYYDHCRQLAYVSPKRVFDYSMNKDLLASRSAPIQAAITRANDELRMQKNAALADPSLQSSGTDTNMDETMSRP